jgi:trimethylamine--corrinoid protein Co-methyltransferase
MEPKISILSDDEKAELHERSLRILSATGVRVETAGGRTILQRYGAQVDKNSDVVRLPRKLIEQALHSAPKKFSLGARRPGKDLPMNAGACTLLMSGEGTHTRDPDTEEYRDSTFDDWLGATRLADALDEIGAYWCIVTATDRRGNILDYVRYLHSLFGNFSKHVQDAIASAKQASWLAEALQIVFGSKQNIREKKPFSFVLCPQSPLIIDRQYTDAYLELAGYGLPVAVVPMPLMGASAPASMAATLLVANCEILATLCLVQACDPGSPVIYAPVSTLIDPRTGLVKSGAVERGLISAASTEMARFYGLPAQTSGLGTVAYAPGIQSSYEASMTAATAMLARPDILVGAGLLGSSMILSLEKMLVDVEIYNMCMQTGRGILTDGKRWMDDVIAATGPGGHFLDHPSTLRALRNGEWCLGKLAYFDSFEAWDANGRKTVKERARERASMILNSHKPIPLGEDVDREFEHMKKRASKL